MDVAVARLLIPDHNGLVYVCVRMKGVTAGRGCIMV